MANEKRLISADRFCDFVDENCTDRHAELWKELIRRQPTVDAVEVVHAEWVWKDGCFHCTNCKKTEDHITKYCNGCGAKMDGGNDDANKD